MGNYLTRGAAAAPHESDAAPHPDLISLTVDPEPAYYPHVAMTSLVDLPPEILLEILSYNAAAHDRHPLPTHPLNALALTNKHLNRVVEEYCRNRLKKYTKFTPPKGRAFSCRKKWLGETCQFCKRKSARRAVFADSLTCCRMCDKQYFPKMTMTEAHRSYSLSKLDLFTPNSLHPHLPPLTTGIYTVGGSPAIMILESDVVQRQAHILSLLRPEFQQRMPRRTAAHARIINHMGVWYCPRSGWCRSPRLSAAALEKAAKSMQTEEGRRDYVKKALAKEWEMMGRAAGGWSADEPLEVESEVDEADDFRQLMLAEWEYLN
ncbi:hypothetical protein ACEQ8H_003768 [Pleosporales sp. CAS-2024a]